MLANTYSPTLSVLFCSVRHQHQSRRQNAAAKTIDDVARHDVADLLKKIRDTAAAADDDERTGLLSPADHRPATGGRRRLAMSARNVVTLTRLARLMKGGGEGGPDGLAADQLPHIGDVLTALKTGAAGKQAAGGGSVYGETTETDRDDGSTSTAFDGKMSSPLTMTTGGTSTANTSTNNRTWSHHDDIRTNRTINPAFRQPDRSRRSEPSVTTTGRPSTYARLLLPALKPTAAAWKIPFWSPPGPDASDALPFAVTPPQPPSYGGVVVRRRSELPDAATDLLGDTVGSGPGGFPRTTGPASGRTTSLAAAMSLGAGPYFNAAAADKIHRRSTLAAVGTDTGRIDSTTAGGTSGSQAMRSSNIVSGPTAMRP